MLAGGETMPPAPDFDIRRAPMVMGSEGTLLFMSPIAAAAAAAATMFALLFVTLLRRATRWAVLIGPVMTVCEFVRECDCRAEFIPVRELEESDGR